MKQVTEAVFLDLIAANDSVWLTDVHIKIQKAISCTKTTGLIMNLLFNPSFISLQVAKLVSLINLKMVQLKKAF